MKWKLKAYWPNTVPLRDPRIRNQYEFRISQGSDVAHRYTAINCFGRVKNAVILKIQKLMPHAAKAAVREHNNMIEGCEYNYS